MKRNNTSTRPAVADRQPVNHLPQPQARTLKLALDVHLLQHVVAMQQDGSSPKPPQRFTPKDFLVWVEKQISQGWRVVSCYEAGPFGYVLHRQLTALGATNYVIRPRNWDDQCKRVKTDGTDAMAMLNALDRFVAGNPRALALVRVPTQEQERRRSESRIRESLKRDLKMVAQRGRGLALQYGFRLKGQWYGARNWPGLEAPGWLIVLLTPLHTAAAALHRLVREQTQKIEAASTQPKPKGLGRLTEQVIEREVGDWQRFTNRRQVGSYLGLCPSEKSSGQRQQQGHVTKCGNPRLRWALCEAAWRLVKFQPQYRLCRKWRAQIMDPHATAGRRKQWLVALARGFGVDWWRIRTGRTTPQKLGLALAD
ncbi:MAG: IS110 family transposase [Candidatus Acidiferrales bacterium]